MTQEAVLIKTRRNEKLNDSGAKNVMRGVQKGNG